MTLLCASFEVKHISGRRRGIGYAGRGPYLLHRLQKVLLQLAVDHLEEPCARVFDITLLRRPAPSPLAIGRWILRCTRSRHLWRTLWRIAHREQVGGAPKAEARA